MSMKTRGSAKKTSSEVANPNGSASQAKETAKSTTSDKQAKSQKGSLNVSASQAAKLSQSAQIAVGHDESDGISPEDSVSQVGSSSVASKGSSSSIGVRRLEIAARKAAVLAEAAMAEDRRKLEMEELSLRLRKEQLDTKMKLAVLEAEEQVLAGSSAENPILEDEPLDCDEEVVLNPSAKEFVPKQHGGESDNVLALIKRGHEQNAKLIEAISLPSTQLASFNGDPIQYWPFMRAFETAVGKSSVDDGTKLMRLMYYCTGPARKVVESCAVMPPEQGFVRAKELLKERFGSEFIILQTWIQRITSNVVIKANDKLHLQQLADDLGCCKQTLAAMNACNEINNQATLLKIIERLPVFLQTRWKREVRLIRAKYDRSPNIDDVVAFVKDAAAEINDPVYGNLGNNAVARQDQKEGRKQAELVGRRPVAQVAMTSTERTHATREIGATNKEIKACPYCSGRHPLFKCQEFKSASLADRLDFVKQKRLCFNCLNEGHKSSKCRLNKVCSINGCGKRHSVLLHQQQAIQQSERSGVDVQDANHVNLFANSKTSEGNRHVDTTNFRICLPIVPVIVRNTDSHVEMETYALLDTGSTNSFCSLEVAQQLGVKGLKETISLTTLAAADVPFDTSVVNLEVSEFSGAATVKLDHVFVKRDLSITSDMKVNARDIKGCPHLTDIDIPELPADKVGLLIGQDCPEALLPIEVRKGEPGAPFAVRTIFGWTVNGPLSEGRNNKRVTSSFVQADLKREIETFWRSEAKLTSPCVGEDSTSLSVEDHRAVSIWNKSIKRDGDHYSLDIPFRRFPPKLLCNLPMAKQRLESLKRRLVKDEALLSTYQSYMNELLEKGYAERVQSIDMKADGHAWYLPHHPVFNKNKPEKVRIVFDCAATLQGASLNTEVLQGPDLTNTLLGVLLRFRRDQVALMADIEAMFHQVKVSLHHRDYLRFLWWPNGDINSEPQAYRMTVHLFGGVWSPSCCNFALKYTAKEQRKIYDVEITNSVDRNFYVDDFLKSVPSASEAIKVVKEVTALLQTGGFHLTKWISSNTEVMSSISVTERSPKMPLYVDLTDEGVTERALGLKWDVIEDCFIFTALEKSKPNTRRGVLSIINSIFDPLGLISPFILPAKRLLQELCRKGVGWDDLLPETELNAWMAWQRDQPSLQQLKINRCYKSGNLEGEVRLQLHHFCDASSYGYGAVTYIRVVDDRERVNCQLLMAKSKLAPLKPMTIPRLELQAAVLAVKLDEVVSAELDAPLMESVFWTDSTTVLQYIANSDKRFQTFVANRVAVITNRTAISQWRYVDTKRNPADDASRGQRADELIANSRWFNGPDFLTENEHEWPINPVLVANSDVLEFRKDPKIYASCVPIQTRADITDRIFNRRSKWHELKRDIASLLRVRCWLRAKAKRVVTPDMKIPISVDEINDAEIQIIQLVQREAFPQEVYAKVSIHEGGRDEQLHSAIVVSKTSQLYKLEPVRSKTGLLCVGGRLSAHPPILPKQHAVVDLIIRHFHAVSGHSGREYVHALCRDKYWIIKGRSRIRKILASCMHCKKRRAQPMSQKMADLPSDRITAGQPPFTFTGIDLFGPFMVKRGRAEVKRYGCLFTCLTVRAVHIEIVHSLGTDSFINALQRFICRRGQVRCIRSDNGSNFVCAAKELCFDQRRIHAFLRERSVEWLFNPPAASHMGGVWERQIRTVRKILDGVTKQQVMDDEGLTTLMCLVESIINGRPLTTVSDDIKDLEPLSPNHLLLLQSGAVPLISEPVRSDLYSRRRWRQVQYLADIFWKRWTKEYVPSLRLRQKWTRTERNVKVGDVVIIIDENAPRNTWLLGRVVETFASSDGLVRSAKVVTKSSELVRPIHKLCLLEAVE
jgi:hypothetical protein